MPDPKDNQKLSGDTHPPEVEDEAGRPAADDRSLQRDLEDEARPGKGINQAGYLKDKDAREGGKS